MNSVVVKRFIAIAASVVPAGKRLAQLVCVTDAAAPFSFSVASVDLPVRPDHPTVSEDAVNIGTLT